MEYPWLYDENGKPLDEQQKKLAISDDAHLIINAGPGSGKTRVLVAHYLHLLMEHPKWDIDAVVAITFTEKAATEMKERIGKVLQRIACEEQREEQGNEWRKRAYQLLDRLPEAPIGTIHSFCARLLRQFAIEASLDPSFQVLDELQASILRQQVCEQWLWTSITQPPSDEIKSISSIIVPYYGFGRVVEILTKFLNLRPIIEYRRNKGEPILCRDGELTESEEALEQCYDFVAEAYDAAKREINGLDFDDLLLLTWRLLQNSEIRQRVRKQHRHILVDELQDTDRIQAEILRLICGWDEPDSCVKFFGVGDSQQSIYSFRNADVSVFNELWEHAQGSRGWRAERLDINYRSVKPIVDLTNRAFERIFVVSEEDDKLLQHIQTRLQKMRANRGERKCEPCVEFAFFRSQKAQSKWQRLRVEADWIARRIIDLTKNGAKYCNIAILLRELVNASAYEDALRRYNIPYHIIAGYGFFETMEARDLFTFLQVVAEPDDEVAWMAWLRSPMIGVSDETLFWLRQKNLEQLPPEERMKVERAGRLRCEAIKKSDRISVRELLEWILSETRYDVLVAALPQGKQRLANIRKFLRMAQEISDGLKLTVRGLVRYATMLVEGAERIGEPPLAGATTDAVQIMTIHAAKGLEFPIVIVPMLGEVGAPTKSPEVMVADPEIGIAVRRYDETGKSLKREDMPNFDKVEKRHIMRERAESERLLFVACTRAMDRLILVGTEEMKEQKEGQKKGQSEQGEEKGSSWANWLQLVIDALQVPIGKTEFETADGVKVRLWSEPSTVTEKEPMKRTTTIGARWLESSEPTPVLQSERTFDLPLGQPSVIRLSVSELLPFRTSHYASGDDAQIAMELGLVVHALLRYGVLEPTEQQLLWIAQTIGADGGRILGRADDLRAFAQRAASSLAWKEAKQAQMCWHELDFHCRLTATSENQPKFELVGRWDLIAKTQDDWLIVDFKTDKVTSPEDAKRKVDEVYSRQAFAYAYAAHRVFKAQKVRVVFVFVSLSEPEEIELPFPRENDWTKLQMKLCEWAMSRLNEIAAFG